MLCRLDNFDLVNVKVVEEVKDLVRINKDEELIVILVRDVERNDWGSQINQLQGND